MWFYVIAVGLFLWAVTRAVYDRAWGLRNEGRVYGLILLCVFLGALTSGA